MRGAPRKIYLDKDSPVQLGPRIPKHVRDLIPKDANISREFHEFVIVKYGNPDQASLEELKQREMELREDLLTVRGRIGILEAKMKRDEEIRMSMEMIRKYVPHAFRKLVLKVHGNGRHMIMMKPDKINDLYGISFNVEKVNQEFDELIESLGATEDEDLIEKYAIQKAEKGVLEEDIKREMVH